MPGAGGDAHTMDTTEAFKGGHLDEALAAAKDAVRKAPSDARHRSVLFQLYCFQGNWDGAQTQLKLIGDFDLEASMWVGVCTKLLACEAERRLIFEGKQPPTLFGKPPGWVGGLVEAFRLGIEGNWTAAAASQAQALEAAPAIAAVFNDETVEWVADADSRFGPVLEAYIEGKYYWIPFEHVRELRLRPRTHLMDAIWTPADFVWLNEGEASGYIPARYPGAEKSADTLIQLGRKTEWREEAENFYCGSGHRTLVTSAADHPLAEVKSIRFSHPEAPVMPASPGETGDEPAVAEAVGGG